ncbi:hypothetical protein BKA82DRAFT_999716 [Pisolithus tinctorius]|uniref:Uncharacterized protein n=1 Tax=Pisolithus tinctorius Marx 270 TaxID=870435 RepID=A0A0C3PC39_PISTI|nr:hypothetical protein BKA82DRAFT_999716 [Pisolithus tinctorius]KIO05571.1 hypothetical protein M404DRAFT_999716 [Pisolithus tinctorius Marx 270]
MRCDAGGVRRSTISLAFIAAHPPIVLGCIFDNGESALSAVGKQGQGHTYIARLHASWCSSAQGCSALSLSGCSTLDNLSEPQVALVHNTACYLALKQFQRPEPNWYSFIEGPPS